MITNEQLAEALNHVADVLEEYEENPYRIRAYRKAANSLKHHPQNVFDLVERNEDLKMIPNIGEKISIIIKEMISNQNLNWLPTFKPAEAYPEKWLKFKKKKSSYKIFTVTPIIERIISELKKLPNVIKVECVGDYRRKKEVVQSFDIIISVTDKKNLFEKFYSFPSIKYIIKRDENETLVQLRLGIQVLLKIVDEKDFPFILLESTGSSTHYESLQNHAKQKNLILTTQGLYNKKNKLKFSSEESIYQYLDLEFILPELRENRGEIEAASEKLLPKLVELSDIRGDLHCHTNETDGLFTLEEMVEAAKNQGYEYVAITDHSQSLKITNGMDEKRLLKQIKLIDKLNEKHSSFKILKSMEVDILEDGRLDLSNEVLKELDLTVCSIHSKFRIAEEKQTDRILRAMDNPYFNILGHATGRLINHRPPYQINLPKILQAAKERNCFIEVNAQPARLDINDLYCKMAKECGVKVAISSDAHTTKGFQFMILGVNQARRGWLEAKDVINTYSLKELIQVLKRK